MVRMIDADALKAAFEEKSSEAVCGVELCKAIIFRINKEPTIDAVPVRHGKWIIRDNPGTGWYRVTCSECGEDVTSTAPCIGFFPNAKVVWDYCPNCGADMRGDNSEHE